MNFASTDRATARQRRGLILLYHRVAEVPSDPWTMAVSPTNFRQQVEALRGLGPVLSLEQLRAAVADGTLHDRSVALTFDDGYADNLFAAKPVLDLHGLPATVFITVGALDRQREFWWDELERVLLYPGQLPAALSLTIAGQAHQWKLEEDAEYDAEAARTHRHWRAWGQPDPTRRHVVYRSLYQLLYPLSEADREQAQDQLLAWAGLSPIPTSLERPTLSSRELLELERDDSIEIGAHTMTHPLLASAPPAAQRHEIQESKRRIQDMLGHSISSFSYPFGKRGDYTDDTVRIVRESGFSVACSNFPGIVTEGTDPFQLPRIFVGDWDGDEFSRQIECWFKT